MATMSKKQRCLECGAEFIPRTRVHRYCARKCRQVATYRVYRSTKVKEIQFVFGHQDHISAYSVSQLQRAVGNEFVRMANEILNGEAVYFGPGSIRNIRDAI